MLLYAVIFGGGGDCEAALSLDAQFWIGKRVEEFRILRKCCRMSAALPGGKNRLCLFVYKE